ncbi:MAG: sensor domain-containing diguanylate cyclase [Rhodanobacter sp.]
MFSVRTSEALDRLHTVIRTHPQWLWEVDDRYRYTDVSQSLLNLLGHERNAVIGRPVYDFMIPSDATRVSRIIAAKSGRPYSGAISHHLRADGTTIAIESGAVPLQSDDGALKGYRGIAHAVAHFDLMQSDSVYRMRAIYDTAPAALCLVGRDGRYLAANNAYAAIYDLTPGVLIGRKVEELLPGAREMIRNDLHLLDAGHDVPNHEVECRGRIYQVAVRPLQNLLGQVTGITTALMDITERKRAEQALAETNRQLLHYARHDYLTGLANRRYVDEVLASEVRNAIHNGHPLSVLMTDVDFFKRYNDHYGHLLGDECLCMVASKLKHVLHRHSDFAGRYGGEEFVAIMPGTDAIGASKIAADILHAIRELNLPHAKSDFGRVTLSVGVATLEPWSQLPEIDANCEALVCAADKALYAAKLAGRNTICSDSLLGIRPDAWLDHAP